MTELKRLFHAILTVYSGRDEKLKIINHGFFYSYNPQEDDGYQEYKKARDLIAHHYLLNKILTWTKIL